MGRAGNSIAIVGDKIAVRPPFKAADKYLRSSLIKAGINPRKVDFYAPGNNLGDAVYVLAIGSSAIRLFVSSIQLSESEAVGKLHSFSVHGADVLVYCTHHPAYVLRRPSLKPAFINDLHTFSAMVRLDQGVESAKMV